MTSSSPGPSALPCGELTAAPLPSKFPIYPSGDHQPFPRRNGSQTDIIASAPRKTSGRQFNTSRAQKAVNDSSTVDFAYLPSLADIDPPAPRADLRIPVLPDAYNHHETPQDTSSPMRPQVYTVSGEGAEVSVSPMTEVVDNLSVDIDPFSLTETVGKSRFEAELEQKQKTSGEPGIVRELWSGMWEDIFNPKQSSHQKQ